MAKIKDNGFTKEYIEVNEATPNDTTVTRYSVTPAGSKRSQTYHWPSKNNKNGEYWYSGTYKSNGPLGHVINTDKLVIDPNSYADQLLLNSILSDFHNARWDILDKVKAWWNGYTLPSKKQSGGTMENQDEQLNVLAGAMIQLQQLSEAANNGDQQAAAVMQEIQKRAQAMAQLAQQPTMAKCGAKLKKKEEGGNLPAAKCGKKMELGKKITKADCGCKAHLKRVGGKLVTVDCNGNILK